MVTKDDAMEYLVELEDMMDYLDEVNPETIKAIKERLAAIKKYAWNSDYKICPAIKV